MTTLLALIVVLIIYAVIYISKKGNVDKLLEEEAQTMVPFEVKCGIEECFQRIKKYADSGNHTVEAIDEENFKIVIGENKTFTSNGFYFPVFLTFIDKSSTQVEAGIESKTIQLGNGVGKRHREFINELQNAILNPQNS